MSPTTARPRPRRRHRRRARVAALGLALLTAAPLAAAQAEEPGPVHAGNTFGWYPAAERYEFHGADVGPEWKLRPGRGNVRHQHGMLTLNSGLRGHVRATLAGAGHDRGRWEMRWRSRRYERDFTDYTIRTALVPVAASERRCGAQEIALQEQLAGARRAGFHVRTLPDNAFVARHRPPGLNLERDHWHTFAVEVTPDHVTWFVDSQPIVTERRPEALHGKPLTVQFALEAVPGQRMNRTRMQMDWLRYWPLARSNGRSIDAPPARHTTYDGAC